MKTSHALIIGLNSVDTTHYLGWDGKLTVCEDDALAIDNFLKNEGFDKITTLLTPEATRLNVLSEINASAEILKEGDTFLIYYSGHGGNQIPDLNHTETNDVNNETWCLYDAQLIDDELFLCWHQFKKGVKIILISDSCFSGDIAKAIEDTKNDDDYHPNNLKMIRKENGEEIYLTHKDFYDDLLQTVAAKYSQQFSTNQITDKIEATVLQIAASQEGQLSIANTPKFPNNSLFTAILMNVLKSSPSTYENLILKVAILMPSFQNPKFQILGQSDIDILNKKPFN